MGNSASLNAEIYDHDETDEFQHIGELPVVIPEAAITDYEKTIQSVNLQNICDNIEQCEDNEIEEFQNSQNTIVTLDLMDFDNKFPCPICSFEGRDKQLSIVTLSDHMGMHKYENALNMKLKNTQTVNNYNGGVDEIEAVKIAINESNGENNSENKLKVNKLIQAPVIIRKGRKLKMQESDNIDLNVINCD